MRSAALGRVLGALAAPAVILCFAAAGCEPQDIYLFDEEPIEEPDVADDEPEPDPEPPPESDPEPDAGPEFQQPPCTSPACEACVERGDCSVETTPFFCHPETGSCELACDPEASAQRVCTAGERCDARIGLCVACVEDVDCGAGPLSVCDPRRNECVECAVSTTCPLERPVCDPYAGRCIECVDDGDCAVTNEVCLVGQQRCVQCRSNTDCNGLEDDNLCLPGQQRCVECLSDDDCTENGRPFCSSENECEDERE